MGLNQLPSVASWLDELARTSEEDRPAKLREMVLQVKAEGGCGSLQTSSGLPCRRPPKVGYPVCRKHGERAPATTAKAERLLAVARMPAIGVLLDELDQYQEQTCDTCGYPDHGLKTRKHVASVAFKLLDRTGFGPRSTIDLTARRVDEGPLDVSVLTDGEFTELGELLARMEDLKARVQARLAAGATREALALDGRSALLLSGHHQGDD